MIAVMLQAPPLPRHVPPAERGWHFLLHRAPDRMSQGVSGRDEMGVSGSREVSGNPSDHHSQHGLSITLEALVQVCRGVGEILWEGHPSPMLPSSLWLVTHWLECWWLGDV